MNSKKTPATPIKKAAYRENWPLTFAERQMASEHGMRPDSNAYNTNTLLDINGDLDIARLERALAALVWRHTAFRSYYPLEGDAFVHRIADAMPVSLAVEACREDEVEGLVQAADLPYDLARGPLFRFQLYELGEKKYVLHLGIHHIIMDGHSAALMLDDLWHLYNGEELPPAKLDFPDYALWQSELAEDTEAKDFFAAMFEGGVPENVMPTLPKRPDVLPEADTDCVAVVDLGPLDDMARSLGITTFRLLLAAVGLVLAKYTCSEDVTLGVPMSGRAKAQTERMIGMFVNTLPLRVKASAEMTIGAYIRAVVDTLSQVEERQFYPFEEIVPLLAPDRNASRYPIFDMIVNYIGDFYFPDVPGLKIQMRPSKRQAIAIDLKLEFWREGEKLRIILSYSQKLYEDAVISNMMEQLKAIIARLVGMTGDELLCEINELPAAQREQILVDFRGERSDENLGRTLVELIREQAQATPDNAAVAFADERITYKALDERTDHIAAHIAAMDTGSAVGILVNRNAIMPVAALAVLKTGVPYLPLDPSYPNERLEFMLKDAGAKLVIAEPELTGKIAGYEGAFLMTDTLQDLPAAAPPPAPVPDDTMILLYTSGTTGNPKGVMLAHRNLVNFCSFYRRLHKITAKDNIPAYASFGFDAHMMDMYPALMSGACVHIIPAPMRLDLPGLNKYFEQNNISVAFITTQMGRQFAESMDNHSLRALSVGGEALVPIAPPKNFTLFNGYGPTECTIFTNTFPVDRLYDRVPLGPPVANTDFYVVDKHDRLVPVGVAGYLCVAGRQVGKGYLNNPELTAQKFAPNPYSDDPDYATMYRTGDLVRFLPDGNIDFVGRDDFQVKIRGFRVELTEIEERIRAFPGISDAAVLAMDSPGGGKYAAAYIVGAGMIDIEALNHFIEEALPAYMVPTATTQVAAIPLNPNGKVDRRKLPAPSFSAPKKEEARPQNELEVELAKITAEILGHDGFGLGTNLLKAGLSSLSCVRLAATLAERFGTYIAAREIMQTPTLIGIENAIIAALLGGKGQGPKPGPSVSARPLSGNEYPLTHSQRGLYYEYMKNPGSLMYNIPVHIELDAKTDAERLKKAVLALVEAHPALRTRFSMSGNEVWQYPDDTAAVEIDIQAVAKAEVEAVISGFARPFRLFDEPPLRIAIVKSEKRTYLLLDIHHIIFDGFSLGIFVEELAAAYEGRAVETEDFTLFDASLREQEEKDGADYQKAKAFFDRMLTDSGGATEIPYKQGGTSAPHTVTATLNKGELAACLEETGMTAAVLFLAAAAFVTGGFADTETVGLVAVSTGRDGENLSRSVGMFVKTLPLVFELPMTRSVASYVGNVRDVLYGAMAHETYPFTRIAADHVFYPQILYAYQGSLVPEGTIEGGLVTPKFMELNSVKFPISIFAEEGADSYLVRVEYDAAKFDESLMHSYVGAILHSLRQFSAAMEGPLSAIDIGAQEQLKMLADMRDANPGAQRAAGLGSTAASPRVFGDFAGGMEEQICAIFADILGLTDVDAEDNFFQLGGTSLSVTRLVIAAEAAGVKGAGGEPLSYSSIFAHPSPRALATLLGKKKTAAPPPKPKEKAYDYGDIHALLAENTLDAFVHDSMLTYENVLLTGATGFLGIHVLYVLLKAAKARVTCLVRKSPGASAEDRLKKIFAYYFSDIDGLDDSALMDLVSERVNIIEGDMMDTKLLAGLKDIGVVINCAANVAHFSLDESSFNVNSQGVANLVALCKGQGARLIHVSTASVAGFSLDGVPGRDAVMDEKTLYLGQSMENQYVRSKFMAERLILEAALSGLDVKIMRVGNLMARALDGQFQINASSNSFLSSLRAYAAIGYFPYSAYHEPVEFSPIGMTAVTVLQLGRSSGSCRIFHPYNNHTQFLGDIILGMKDFGIHIEMAEDDVFDRAWELAMKDPARVETLTSLIAYRNMEGDSPQAPVAINNDHTTQALLRVNLSWPETNSEYQGKFFSHYLL